MSNWQYLEVAVGYDAPKADFYFTRTYDGPTYDNYAFNNISTFPTILLSECEVLWDFGNGTSTSTSNGVTWQFYPGTYTVSLTITDPLGRSDTMTKTACITVT